LSQPRSLRLEELLSVSDLAAEAGVNPRRLKYRLKLLDERVRREARAEGGDKGDRWGVIVRMSESPTGKIFVRKSALKKYAPELFEVDVATSEEVAQIRRDNEVMRKKVNALLAEVRDLKAFRRRMQEWVDLSTKPDQK
jgi:hypothetical protein